MSNALIFKNYNKAAVIQFNCPEIRSPLSIFVLEELHEIVGKLAANSSIETLIFTGRDDVFASGADLREIAEVGKNEAREFALRGQILMNKIAALSQTTVAAINGFCFGGALDLALACDKRIAAPNASFSHPGANLGIITGWGGTQRLPRLIGEARALEMFFTAKRLDADEALNVGLIDRIAGNPLEEMIANYRFDNSSLNL
jgi:enoyl-CoA hydratase